MCNLLNCFVLYSGGSRISHGRGGQLPMHLHFEKFVCPERIGTLKGGAHRGCPLDPPMVYLSFCYMYDRGGCDVGISYIVTKYRENIARACWTC